MRAQVVDHREDRGEPVSEQLPPLVRIVRLEGERLEDLLLALRAEAGEGSEPLGLRRLLQACERRDVELPPDARRRLRPQPGEMHERDHVGRNESATLRERVDVSRLDDLDDLLLDRLADPL